MNAQTLKFRQLEVRSDLSNYCAFPGQYSFVFTQRLGSPFSMHIYSYNLTACEPASLLIVGCSFETSTVPNLQFPNYDRACELS